MIIYKINIISFAGIKNKIIEFDEKINVIYGENEKGKSSIENFIRVFLYGLNSKRSKDIKENDRLRFMPIDEDKIKGELYIEFENRKYIIKRTFGKTKKDDVSQIIDAETGEEIKNISKEEPGKYFFSVNASTFNKTLFIRQLGVEITKEKEEEIIDRAANLLDNDEENINIQKAFDRLEVLKKEIATPRKNGRLDNVKAKLSKLMEEKYEAYNLSEEGLENEKNLINSKSRRNEIRDEINNLNIYKKYIRKIKLQKEYEDITNYLIKKEELEKENEEISRSLKSKSGIIDEAIIENIKNENSLYLSLKDIRNEELKALEEKKEEYEKIKYENRDLLFLEKITVEEKNSFIKNVMEEEIVREKIKKYNSLKKEIYEAKEKLENEIRSKGITKELKDNINEIKSILGDYESKLIALKSNIEEGEKLKSSKNKRYKTKNNIFLILFLISTIGVLLFSYITQLSLSRAYLYFLLPLVFLALILVNKIIYKEIEDYSNSRKLLEKEIGELEKEIFNFTKIINVKNYEEFILQIKAYEAIRGYIEIENIKISEKIKLLDEFKIVDLKLKQEETLNEINKIKYLARIDNNQEIINSMGIFENLRREIYSLELDIEKLEKSLDNHENEIKVREERIYYLMDELGLENIEIENVEEVILDLREKIKKREEVINALNSIDETYKALTKDKDIEEIKENLKDIINANLSYNYSSEEEIDLKLTEKSNELIEIEKLIKDLENEINNRFLGKRKITEIEEDIESSLEEIKDLENKLKAIEIALETMKEALREVRGNFSEILNDKVIYYFNKLTNDKYSEVLVSENYEMKIRENNDILSSNLLSNGANDQLYLSLRLAFINMIYKNMKCPFFLDDAFIQYDDLRLSNALDIIKDIDFSQIFILTCQRREENYFKERKIKINYINL